ncbi:MAG: 30S ribosomal protein S20 [Lentisphaerae bacterium GWF2_44_16]|nr:MAG: 30S ribosomal protein S20 [Lentisphaerae bacterium GWF2_44_16]
MPTSKSAAKRVRTSEKSRIKNKSCKSAITTLEKNFRIAVEASDLKKAEELLANICASLDKAAKTGVFHNNKSNRKKSRLSVLLNVLKKKA